MPPRRPAALVAALLLLLAPGLAPAAGPIRLATFNIHHAEGADGVLDVGRVADVVKGSDLIAIQEVDVRFGPRSRLADQATALGERLGMRVAFGGNLKSGTGEYGVALLSRFPIVSQRNHPLPHSSGREKAEPRGLLEATVDADGRRLRVFVTHLAHDSADDRRLQVEAIRARLADGEGPAILMGDLNFRPEDPVYARLLAPAEGSDRPLLVDAWPRAGAGAGATIGLNGARPARIDYILATPDLAGGFRNARVDVQTKASDHQPVFVELELPAPPPAR
jgi:endonuclease/exonuclease/phosphatase family metal-dependent hydrolase